MLRPRPPGAGLPPGQLDAGRGVRHRRRMDVAAFFTRTSQGYLATPAARSPWNHQRVHGRVVSGLLACALEAEFGDPQFMPARVTTDLYRLPEYAPITIETRLVRDGRRIRVVDAEFFSGGVSAARATCQFLRRSAPSPGRVWSPPPWNAPRPDDLPPPEPPARGPIGVNLPIPNEGFGPNRRWFKERLALIEGEVITPFVRVAMSADMTSGIANAAQDGVGYINSDVTLYLHRPPRAEWIGYETVDHGATDGVAVGSCRLYDLEGHIGAASICGLAQVLDR